MSRPNKVAILGGGVAALTAAFELTGRPNWQQQFSEVALYQVGWRLGGKASSGRNRRIASRSEGNGPHLWFGFYDHAFRLVRRCYEELDRPADRPFAKWQDAFIPHRGLLAYDNQTMQPWPLERPLNDAQPGEAAERTSPWRLVARSSQLVAQWWSRLRDESAGGLTDSTKQKLELADQWVRHAEEYCSHLHDAVEFTGEPDPLMATGAEIQREVRRSVADYIAALPQPNPLLRRLGTQIDLTTSALHGALRDRVPTQGFEALDHLDFRSWLSDHGGSPASVSSPVLSALYGLTFASVGGDPARQNLAAGVGLRLLCRAALDFRGALAWTTPIAIGEALIAPLYEVLRRRGVKFHFFHRLEGLRLNDSSSQIAEIRLHRQATPIGPYEPLTDVAGVPCWPSEPHYDQLKEGPQLEAEGVDLESPDADWPEVESIRLRAGEHFDQVVLGVSVAALPDCCRELLDASPRWSRMVKGTATAPTIVSNLWFHSDLAELGWKHPPPAVAGLQPPLHTWIEFSEAARWETWDAGSQPAAVASLRGPLPERTQPAPTASPSSAGRAEAELLEWFERFARHLWPGLVSANGELDWDQLVDPEGHQGAARLSSQYARAVSHPSDRYVQSVAGSLALRLTAGVTEFDNLLICGDWTRTALNVGCVEAAVMSGLAAAAAARGEAPPRGLIDG